MSVILVAKVTTAAPIAHSSANRSTLQKQDTLSETPPFFAEIAELSNVDALDDLSVAETHIFRPLFRHDRHELYLTS